MKSLIVGLVIAASSWFGGDAPQDDSGFAKKSFQVQQGGMLEVDVDAGAVEVETWDKNEVYIEADGIDERHPERLKMTQSGNKVRVEYRSRRSRSNDIRFTINVPSTFNCDLQTGGGSVVQSGQLTGTFDGKTGGGSVKVEHVIGSAALETGGGSVKVENVEGDVKIQTGGGSVEAKKVSGTLDARTGGGSIKAVEVGKKLKISTGGGSIRIGDAGAETDASTGGGSIVVGKVKSRLSLSTGGGSVEVRGSGDDVDIKTGGGSITAEEIHGNLNVKTGGGSIKAEIVSKGSGSSSLESGGGDVALFLPENSKAEVSAHVERGGGFWNGGRKKIDIRSDFKPTKYEKSEDGDEIDAVYVLNGGGEKIRIETTNGVIEVRKK